MHAYMHTYVHACTQVEAKTSMAITEHARQQMGPGVQVQVVQVDLATWLQDNHADIAVLG